MLQLQDIRIRDPFILTDKESGCYYMYGTTALKHETIEAGNTFSVYKSYDLKSFEEPKVILDGSAIGLWADRDFWAPEVHMYEGKYYLFGSCKAEGRCRGTQIFVCDTPDGCFTPLSDSPITPSEWECLDGTLFVEDGTPYIVFCHEWVQVKDGELWAMPLTKDLSRPAGECFRLFAASEDPHVTELTEGSGDYVTDGPFLYRTKHGIHMIWSSFYRGQYRILNAEAPTLRGPWTHLGPTFDFDGGHAMIFELHNGTRCISLHSPNRAGEERAVFLPF